MTDGPHKPEPEELEDVFRPDDDLFNLAKEIAKGPQP